MGDKSKGWILLYRSIRDSWLWEHKPFDPARAWIDLILDANHDEGKVFTGSSLIHIKRGQDLISIRSLANRWGWSKDRVSHFLKLLESDNMIRLSSLPGRRTLLTIVNYGFFQNRPDTNKDTNRTQTRTRTGHRQGQNKEELKEELKEGKKERDLPSEEDSEDLSAWEALEDDDATT